MSSATVYSLLTKSEHIRPLSQQNRGTGYLQVLLPDFTMTRDGEGVSLRIDIADDPLTLADGRGKRDLESASRQDAAAGRVELQQQLDRFQANAGQLTGRMDCSNWPMRYANGGALPIIEWNGEDYFLLFYRDIFPIGWNIANGASDNSDEWLDPGRIVLREFGEELLIVDLHAKPKPRVFIHEPPGAAQRVSHHEEPLAAWGKHYPQLQDVDLVPMPLTWIAGPDSVETHFAGRQQLTENVFVSVTPADHGIEADRLALIRVPGDVQFLDGEIANGHLFNHVVGLFHVERFGQVFQNGLHEFRPDFYFFNGQRFETTALQASITEYIASLEAKHLRRPDQKQHYLDAEVRFDLCPISRAVIGRYFGWRESGVERAATESSTVR